MQRDRITPLIFFHLSRRFPSDTEFTLATALDRSYKSEAKSLLYGGARPPALGNDARQGGKKMISHATSNGCPFATIAPDDLKAAAEKEKATYAAPAHGGAGGGGENADGHDRMMRSRKKHTEGTSKIGAGEYDADVYRQALADNVTNMEHQKKKNAGQINLKQ